jgi:hypothetical protein
LNHPLARTRGKRFRRVGVRGIGVSGGRKLLQLEVTIRDFPIVTKVWAIGAIEKDKCQRVNLAGANTKWHRGSVRAVDHDLVSVDFPTGKIPDKSKESVGEYSSGFGDL